MITDIYEFFASHQKKSKKSKSLDIFNQANWFEIFFDKSLKPSEIIRELYLNRFEKILGTKSNVNSLRGSSFENLILAIFLNNQIKPIYEQCTLQFVPNVRFDFVLFENLGFGDLACSCSSGFRLASLSVFSWNHFQ